MISVDPKEGCIRLSFNSDKNEITKMDVKLEAGKEYAFTYMQEGSVGVFYIDGEAALTARIYGVSGKPIRLFSENNTVEFKELKEFTAE